METKKADVICYGLVRGRDWQQEHYETARKDAGRRARELRKAGFKVAVSPLGLQVTNVGTVRMTMVTIHHLEYGAMVPDPKRIERN